MRLYLLAAPLAWWSCAAVAATVTQPSREDEIVVVGETMKEAQKQAQIYVNEVGIAAGERPTARWVDPICPKAIGLAPDKEVIVRRQIRELVRQVGAPLGREDCAANLLVVFTDGPEAVVARMTQKGSALLRGMPASVAQEIRTGAAPIRWFYQTDVRSREGMGSSDVVNPALLTAVSGQPEGPAIRYGDDGLLNVKGSSHIASQSVRTIKHATVIVDVLRAKGNSLRAITDYAALVGLAEIKFGASPQRSILSMFDPQAPVSELSKRDVAMLTGLYRIHLDRRAEQQRRTLVNRILKTDLEAEARRAQ